MHLNKIDPKYVICRRHFRTCFHSTLPWFDFVFSDWPEFLERGQIFLELAPQNIICSYFSQLHRLSVRRARRTCFKALRTDVGRMTCAQPMSFAGVPINLRQHARAHRTIHIISVWALQKKEEEKGKKRKQLRGRSGEKNAQKSRNSCRVNGRSCVCKVRLNLRCGSQIFDKCMCHVL